VGLKGKEVVVGEIRSEGGHLECLRYESGDLNLTTLVAPSEKEKETTEPKESSDESDPWRVTLKKVLVDGYTVRIQDSVPKEPVDLLVENLKFGAEEISTIEKSRGSVDVAFQVNKQGSFATKGSVGINPLFTDLNVDVKDLALVLSQPYVSEQLELVFKDGRFSTQGNLALSSSEQGDIITQYKGKMGLSDLACVDKQHKKDLVKWKSLQLKEMDLGFNPTHINIQDIALDKLFANLKINPDKKLNFQTIVAEKNGEAPAPAKEKVEEKESQAINIQKVRLKDGHIRFVDKSVEPSYATDLKAIEGTVTGLSSEKTKKAEVSIKAKLGDHAPLKIAGKVSPLSEDLFLDLKMSFQHVELSPMTPYSGKYVGYAIGKGKLSLDLAYLIDEQKVDAQNTVKIDQLTFGNKVESPDATSLPVTLGVALLKDRNGIIDLNIPVSGNLDDPEFSVGSVIVKTIMNLLVKAATSPFALLGAAFGGGGEELSVVEFEYGRSKIPDSEQKKLETLTNALYERPALNLDIAGHVDMEQDREGLKKHLLKKKVLVQKLKKTGKKDGSAQPVEAAPMEPDEYEKYLRKAYKEETFKKPKNFIGLDKKLPVPEMEKLMLEHIKVEDDDINLLALERAKAVKKYLLDSGKVEPERVFLTKPESLVPEKKEGLKDSRVELKLK
jgi:hypothetical protein